ncbi:hypothetical protein VQL36_19140 [Chengkuizengella sp. SCS-71B]|uniref:hypothetical protein n=1 Tax=Chengkuizengella sp. SCS-71B TaxID=3115290 RepID=UPI0032C21FCF
MGQFNESICDCCVCPMQCVLKQLIGEEVTIFTSFNEKPGTLTEVDDFIAVLDLGTRNAQIPVSSICAVLIGSKLFDFKLKPIKKSLAGECLCNEDPITNLAKSKIGDFTTIQAGQFCREGTIRNVGEGIVTFLAPTNGSTDTVAISSCKIDNFGLNFV